MADTIFPPTIPGTSADDDFIGTVAGTYSGSLLGGNDSLDINAPAQVTVDGAEGNDTIELSRGNALVYGSTGNDSITASEGFWTI